MVRASESASCAVVAIALAQVRQEIALTSVRKALDALKEEGLTETNPMGTFVAPRVKRSSN